jgi:hypothetical protein
VGRDEIEDFGEELALDVFQPDLRGVDEADVAGRLGQDDGLVMAKRRLQ